ncbi:MAG: Uma2 family endonuclease [Terracidiphilus sp.]|jgi:Uma2 family endonuclease
MSTFLEIPALSPRSIALTPPLSDEEFERLCESCEFGSVERTREGTIIVNPPAGSMTSDGNSEINQQLRAWWKQHRRGRVYDSSAGFFLPDTSVLNPDAAYITSRQLEGLERNDLAHFLRVAPAFVLELLSVSDSLAKTKRKMEAWTSNGVEFGWLVDPYARQVHIYESGAAPRIETGTYVIGSGPIAGFVLDLEEVWRCYE